MALALGPSIRRAALVAIPAAVLAFPAAVWAATPTPAPTPAGFRAHAHATLSLTSSSGVVTGNVAASMEQRANVTRVDILSVKSDTMPLPPIAFSAVVDQTARTITIWNDATKRYYVQVIAAATPAPAASATPKPTSSTPFVSPFAGLDVLSMSLKLTGHTTTNGVATTGLAADILVAKKGETATTHIAADAQIVDDFAFVPMTFNLTVEPATGPTKVALAFAVDDLTRGAPPAAAFVVPMGYTKTRNVFDVIMARPPTAAQLTH